MTYYLACAIVLGFITGAAAYFLYHKHARNQDTAHRFSNRMKHGKRMKTALEDGDVHYVRAAISSHTETSLFPVMSHALALSRTELHTLAHWDWVSVCVFKNNIRALTTLLATGLFNPERELPQSLVVCVTLDAKSVLGPLLHRTRRVVNIEADIATVLNAKDAGAQLDDVVCECYSELGLIPGNGLCVHVNVERRFFIDSPEVLCIAKKIDTVMASSQKTNE